jgi:hypothetical protein
VSQDYLLTFLSTGPDGEQYSNTICVHDDEFGGDHSPSYVVDQCDTWLSAKYRACMPPATILNVLRCFAIPDTYGADTSVAEKVINGAGTGAASDGQFPREVTMTLALRSDSTSRRRQGRISLPSPLRKSAFSTDGTWATADTFWTNAGLFGQALLDGHDEGIGGVDGHLSTRVYSRTQHKEGTGDKTHDVKSYIRRPRPRWLRRRVSIP